MLITLITDAIVAVRSASATRPDRVDKVFGLYPSNNKNNNSSRSGLGEKMRSFINYELKPLRDIVLAIQMNSKFLPDFVKTELYKGQFFTTTTTITTTIT